jgi:hypothetical protein
MEERPMRIGLAMALIVAAGSFSLPAIGQIPNSLISGTIQRAFGTAAEDFCEIDGGPSEFRSNGSYDFALMTFGPIYYWSGSVGPTLGATAYTLGGQVQLNFSSRSTGYMKFTNDPTVPGSVAEPEFSNYIETYHTQSQKLTVSFDILFPSCTLAISATYQN